MEPGVSLAVAAWALGAGLYLTTRGLLVRNRLRLWLAITGGSAALGIVSFWFVQGDRLLPQLGTMFFLLGFLPAGLCSVLLLAMKRRGEREVYGWLIAACVLGLLGLFGFVLLAIAAGSAGSAGGGIG